MPAPLGPAPGALGSLLPSGTAVVVVGWRRVGQTKRATATTGVRTSSPASTTAPLTTLRTEGFAAFRTPSRMPRESMVTPRSRASTASPMRMAESDSRSPTGGVAPPAAYSAEATSAWVRL